MDAQINRLFRSRQERMVGGVCGGIGIYFGIDPTLVRLLFVFGTLMGFQGLLAYLVLLIVVPEAPQADEVGEQIVTVEAE
jgi:phage shock protein PspC (stress-responsive transcriptional regulator)